MVPDAAVIQQNYGEDDTESNLVTDKLDEESDRRRERRTRDIPKMSYAAAFGGSIIPSQCGNCLFGGLVWHYSIN